MKKEKQTNKNKPKQNTAFVSLVLLSPSRLVTYSSNRLLQIPIDLKIDIETH